MLEYDFDLKLGKIDASRSFVAEEQGIEDTPTLLLFSKNSIKPQ